MNLDQYQLDALTEILNIGVGKAAGMMNDMINSHVKLTIPSIRVLSSDELEKEIIGLIKDTLAVIRLDFKGNFSGTSALMFSTDNASKLVDVLTGDESMNADLDSIRIGTLTEIGNIMLNGVMGTIGNIMKQQINYSIPLYQEGTFANFLDSIKKEIGSVEVGLMVNVYFIIEKFQISGEIMLVLKLGSITTLINSLEI